MLRNRLFVLAAAALLSLGLFTSPLPADETCKKVQANVKALGEFLQNPALCDGYDFCQAAEVRGTLNGTWWCFGYWADQPPITADTLLFNCDSVFETNQGDVFVEERGAVNLLASDGYAAHMAVVGGSGKYEGATGWLTATLTFYPFRGGKVAGEICTPDGYG